MKMLVVSLALLTTALTARATEFDHYQIILDRHPFGALAGVNTNVMPDFAKSLRLSAIWVAHGQCRAGIEDNTTKLKRDFVLSRGELSEDGLELVDVNIADEAAVIRKGTETATLHVQAGASTNMPVVSVPGMPGQPGGGSSGNPWRDFYERYRQRHQDGSGGPQPPVFPMQGGPGVPGGSGGIFQIPGGGTFSVNSSGGAQGQPIVIQMTAPQAVVDQNRDRSSKLQGQLKEKSSAISSKKHYNKH